MSMLEVARKWASKANLVASEAGLELLATIDPEEAESYLTAGRNICLVEVEEATLETWAATEYKMRFLIISPIQNAIAAWDSLEELAAPLLDPLEVETTQLMSYGAKSRPCMALRTVTTEID